MLRRHYTFPKFFALGNAPLPYTYEQVRDYILANRVVKFTSHNGYPVFYEWILPILNKYGITLGPIRSIITYVYRSDPASATLLLHYALKKHYKDNLLLNNTPLNIDMNEEFDYNDRVLKDLIGLVVPFMPYYYKGVGDRGYHTMIRHGDLIDQLSLLVAHRAILNQARNILHKIGYTLEDFVGRPYNRLLNTMIDNNVPEYIPVIILTHLIYALYKYNSIYTQL